MSAASSFTISDSLFEPSFSFYRKSVILNSNFTATVKR